jgi:hypothetical protein
VGDWVVGRVPPYPLDRRLGEPQSMSGHSGVEKNLSSAGNRNTDVY